MIRYSLESHAWATFRGAHRLPRFDDWLHGHRWRVTVFWSSELPAEPVDAVAMRRRLEAAIRPLRGRGLHRQLGSRATNEGIAGHVLWALRDDGAICVRVDRDRERIGASAHLEDLP